MQNGHLHHGKSVTVAHSIAHTDDMARYVPEPNIHHVVRQYLRSCAIIIHIDRPKHTTPMCNKIDRQGKVETGKWSDAHPPINIIGRFFMFSNSPIPACFAFFLFTAAPMISRSRWSGFGRSLPVDATFRASICRL